MIAKYFKVFLIFSLVSFSVMGQVINNGNGNRNSGSSCCDDFVIQVNGDGKVQLQPDIAILNIGVSVTEKTSSLATKTAATKINQVNGILTANKIRSSDIQTTYLSVNPNFNFSNGNAVITGQTASQTLTVTVRNLGINGETIGTLVDLLAEIDGVQINGLTFDKDIKSQAIK
jgi:uncharacterized protein YggE